MKKTIKRKGFAFVLTFLLLFGGAAGWVKAAETKFPSKNITFIVPVTPGGGFDTYSRILAPFLKKYLPGQPNVIIKNVPGGEWRVGIRELLKSKPDGHTICIFNIPGNIVGQITGEADYDLTKVAWIGRIVSPVTTTCLSAKSKLRTLEDLRKTSPVKYGAVGLSSTSTVGQIIVAEEMGYKLKLINHPGSQECMLSAIRGDVDLVAYAFSTVRKFFDSKELIPLVIYAKERFKEIPDTPTIGELGPGYDKLIDVVSNNYMVGGPPGIPEDILKVWGNAFEKSMSDPEFKKMMESQIGHALNPLNGEQTAQKVKDCIKNYAKYKDLLLEYTSK